nr:tetratricopeptide repeat protein [Thermoanaerobaculia bacterium]
ASGSEAEARARRRGCDSARQLARRLAGDLDTLVEAALRPEAERRYESASRLVEDVERYLAGQPILARPDSLLYRGGKFLRRHRTTVAAAMAGILALCALSIAYTVRLRRERNTAELEAAKAHQVAAFLTGLFEASDPYGQPRPGGPTALELVDEGSRRIGGNLEAQPEVRASLLHTLAFVYRRMVKLDQAEPLIAQAVDLRRRTLGPHHPDTLDSLFEQAMLWRLRGRSELALAQVEEVAAAWEALYGPWHPKLGLAQVQIATLLASGHGKLVEARRAGERGVAILSRAQPAQPAELASAHHVLASILLDLGEGKAGIEHQRQAVALYDDRIDPSHLKRGAALSDLGVHLEAAGRLAE